MYCIGKGNNWPERYKDTSNGERKTLIELME
jgi:hypothetical protein